MVYAYNLPGTIPGRDVYCAYAPYDDVKGGIVRKESVLNQVQGVHNRQHETSFKKVQVRCESVRYTRAVGRRYKLIPTDSTLSTPILRSGKAGPYVKYVQPWPEFMPEPGNLDRLLKQQGCTRKRSLSYWSYSVKGNNIEATWNQLYFPVITSSGRRGVVYSYRHIGKLTTADLQHASIEATAKLSTIGTLQSKTTYVQYEGKRVETFGGEIPPQWFNLQFVEQAIVSAKEYVVPTHKQNQCMGEALLSCVANAQVSDVINLENIIQLVELVRDPYSIVAEASNLISPTTSKKQAIKKIADAKLSYDYSVKTTCSDVATLSRQLKQYLRSRKWSESIARGRSSFTHQGIYGQFSYRYFCQEAYKVYYGSVDESLIPFYRGLQNIGADPSFEHVWNTIPYSFVVDWLYPVSKLFEQIDYETNVATLPIHAVTHGKWETHSFSSEWLKVEVSTFNRDLAKDLPDFPYFLPEFSPNMNWWNAGALIIQRFR